LIRLELYNKPHLSTDVGVMTETELSVRLMAANNAIQGHMILQVISLTIHARTADIGKI